MSQARDIAKALQLVNTDTNTVITSAYDSDSLKSSVTLGVNNPTGTIAVAVSADLPTTTTAGSQALVTSTGRLYIFNGSGWYNIATINATPYWIDEALASYTLATDGTGIHVQIAAGDSDGTTPTYTATGDSGFNAIATVTKDSDQGFTIRSIDSDGSASQTGGSGVLTFRASDGIDQASTASTFTIAFGPNWSAVPTKTKIITGPAASRLYGLGSVCTNSDGTYVGARDHNNGVADYDIWYKSGGSWSKQATLVPTGGSAPGSNYQQAGMSDNGDYLILGDHSVAKAFVYYRTGTSWALQATITCPIANEGDFGWSCDMSGDGNYFIVSDRSSTGSDYGGQAWVYKRSGTSWSVEQQLTQPSSSSNYGISVCIDKTGTYAFVGDWGYNSDTGRGYVWVRSGTTWTLQQTIAGSTTASGDRFGVISAISGNGEHVAVSAAYDDDGASGSGTVFMFSRSGTTWTQRAAITPAAITNGNTGIRGMGIDDAGENLFFAQRNGSSVYVLYIYSRSGNTWSQTRQLDGIDGTDQYANGMTGGRAMSGDGKVVFSGAYYNNDGSNQGAGAVYEFVSG